MPISGLVVTLSEDTQRRAAALAELRRHDAIEVGEVAGERVPIVVTSADSDEDRRIWDWLSALPGVLLVSVAYIHFEESEAADLPPAKELHP